MIKNYNQGMITIKAGFAANIITYCHIDRNTCLFFLWNRISGEAVH